MKSDEGVRQEPFEGLDRFAGALHQGRVQVLPRGARPEPWGVAARIRGLSRLALFVWYRNALSYRRFIPSTLVASIGEPLLYLVAMGLGLGSYLGLIDGKPYLSFIAPGLVVSAAMFSATYECTFSSMVRMTIERIYNSLLVTPVSVEDVIAGEILWGITRGFVSGLIMLAMLVAFGIAKGPALLWIPLLLFAVGFLFASLAMVMTAFAPHFDFFTYYLQLFISPMFFFSGIFFPLDAFPGWVRSVAACLPLTHAVAMARALVAGSVDRTIFLHAAVVLMPGAIAFLYALHRMRLRLVK
jgi:lipooligosaccharide transport system permease protein